MDADASAPAGFAGGATPAADVTTMVLQGTAQFLVDRAKSEVLDFLQETLATELCGRLPGAGAPLFTRSCAILADQSGTNASLALTSLPTAFQEDLREVPMKLLVAVLNHLGLTPAQAGALEYAVRTSWTLAQGLREAGPLDAIQRALSESYPAALPAAQRAEVDEVRQRLRVMSAFLTALQAAASELGSSPVDSDMLARIVAEIHGSYDGDTSFSSALGWLDSHVEDFGRLATRVEALRRASSDSRVDAARSLIHEVVLLFTKAIPRVGLYSAQVLTFVDEVVICYDAFASNNYLLGITRVLSTSVLRTAIANMPAGSLKTVVTQVRSHLLLVGTLASATTSDQVRVALEAAAAPPHSWREYRRRPALFLSGWVGVMGNYEHVLGKGHNGYAVSPAIMVGPEFGFPLLRTGWSVNVFLPLLDLGALASIRLDGNSATTSGDQGASMIARRESSVSFASVFAPGLFVGVGIGNTPFVVGAGVQYAPSLREYFQCGNTPTCSTTEALSTLRFGLTLAVDLPVFSIY